ncbi:short chain dehydrogenase [Bordetella pertussis]|nr:short chain dehydrogenase [Bordetella pertussis]
MAFTRALGGEGPRHGVRVFGVNPSRTRAGYLSATVIDLDGGEQYRGAA